MESIIIAGILIVAGTFIVKNFGVNALLMWPVEERIIFGEKPSPAPVEEIERTRRVSAEIDPHFAALLATVDDA